MIKKSVLAVAVSSALMLTACNDSQETAKENSAQSASKVETSVAETNLDASAQANKLFDELYKAGVMRNPMFQTYLGIKDDYDKWNDISEENTLKELAITKKDLATIKAIDVSKLDAQTKISHTLYVQKLENSIADHKWRFHSYPVNQMFGLHSQIPAFLINQHSIANEKEAQDYISRVKGTKTLLKQLVDNLKLREERGIIAPKFVFEHVIRDSNNIITGAPFENGEASTVLADFTRKVTKLEIDEEKKSALIKAVETALTTHLKPGYEDLITYLNHLESKADDRDGAWKFPEGEAFFNNALKRTTTTDLTANEIHEIGLSEVSRIHDEMRVIKDKVGFEGDLKAFMEFMRSDKQFYYAGDEAGKARYLSEAVALIDDMKGRLDSLFLTKPKAELKVKAVEAFREKSAGKAFYQSPAPDGSRPGIYYANLYDMEAMPTYQMAALAYHEGIPGHHMQMAIKQELEGLPMFRKYGGYTAHTEGWGLYSEMIPKEIGLYQDPYSDFGRLAMELWRACRLVVDTGIHTKKWTREQGIEYYVNNTPNAKSDAVKMVERHVVMPSQATAYKIGMLKIVELREKAKTALGEKFDIREYHDIILKNGPVPLNVLEDFVAEYIASKS
ncbi:DUF885 domain-containing protein [Thalassotalea castellviae]|uniref:DUF885 domain-containing protein n=1 Tax=Thalassotalea castellviae TaxID=3075612 RepID=A0ABU3A4S0_9GAMM|nr:DUF885 domain-containing protein [Thalassotalea sp. W431]MDT0605164.1 DUF885 domain-containing protein [Thalassotalea sp. W431]